MFRAFLFKVTLLFLFAPWVNATFAQSVYDFKITKTIEYCLKASASLEITGTDPADTVSILWSTGQADTKLIDEIVQGDYNVNIKIKHKVDTVVHLKDTTLYFSIDKEFCAVAVDKYFSPNDDEYHDVLTIGNVQYYPDFELIIFNKWGQQIHSQRKTYVPWDGKWLGIDLPDGTYYYIFFYTSSQKDKLAKGDITILR